MSFGANAPLAFVRAFAAERKRSLRAVKLLRAVGQRDYRVITIAEAASMKTRIVRIGNSQGLRLPRPLLDLAGFAPDAEVDVEARAGELVVRPLHGVRAGWADAFARMARAGDDTVLDPPAATDFDAAEWQW